MKSIYEHLDEAFELKPVKCQWCKESYQDLYWFDDEAVCRNCLDKEKIEKDEFKGYFEEHA